MNQLKKTSSPLTFFDHADELRARVLRMVGVILLAALAIYAFIGPIMDALIKPIGVIVFTAPADAFMARIYLTLLIGFLVALPYVLYETWGFLSAGLKDVERHYAFIFVPLAVCVFFMGAVFAYTIVIPISIRFLLGFASEVMIPMITIKSYVSFVATMVLAFGVVFELPLVLMGLTKLGITTPSFFIQKRKFAVLSILVVSAIITPPDFVTQLMLAGPLVALYEIGILISKMVYHSSER